MRLKNYFTVFIGIEKEVDFRVSIYAAMFIRKLPKSP